MKPLPVIERLVPLGHPNRPGTKLEEFLGLVVHYTANDSLGADDIMNARYFGRKALPGPDNTWLEADGVTPFRMGSAHVIIDEDSVTIAIPLDEVAWGCGDRHRLPWTPELRGQMPYARNVFGNRQNLKTISLEICINRSWEKAVSNAIAWCGGFLSKRGVRVNVKATMDPKAIRKDILPGQIVVPRHFDLTGKICPKPFLDDPRAWAKFVDSVAAGAAGGES